MARKITKVVFRRRKEHKTNYKLRIRLLQANKPRIVIRKTNRYIIVQIVKSEEARDFTVVYTNSKELSKFGWNYGFKNLPAAYLTGFLTAQKAIEKIKEAIIDLGLQRSTKGSRLYATIKGVIDGGLKIICDEAMFPSEERIKGIHLKNEEIAKKMEEIKEKIIKSKIKNENERRSN